MELSEVYNQLIKEIKNNIRYYKDEDIDFIFNSNEDKFNILGGQGIRAQDIEPIQKEKAGAQNIELIQKEVIWAQDIEPIQKEEVVGAQYLEPLQKYLEPLQKDSRLFKIENKVTNCKKCPLYKTRNSTVFGEGSIDAKIMFIGEGPGENEDLTGRPFVGKAGELLVRIIENVMKLKREDVYMANIVKCRPPGNRNPNDLEVSSCINYLHEQIKIVNPQIIVPLGTVALTALLPSKNNGITKNRGIEMNLPLSKDNIYKVIPTYHPSYLLRGTDAEINKKKREVWSDIKKIMEKLG